MDSLAGFASTPIDAFNLVANMPVIMLFSQLCRGTVRGSANLRSEFVAFLLGLFMAEIAYFDMKLTNLLIDFQVLNIQVCHFHGCLLASGLAPPMVPEH